MTREQLEEATRLIARRDAIMGALVAFQNGRITKAWAGVDGKAPLKSIVVDLTSPAEIAGVKEIFLAVKLNIDRQLKALGVVLDAMPAPVKPLDRGAGGAKKNDAPKPSQPGWSVKG